MQPGNPATWRIPAPRRIHGSKSFRDKDALETAGPIGNWQIKVLGQIPEQISTSVYGSEMWFPLMLRATVERDETGKRRGALVGLAGARRAGKTILAMQAMDVQGYILPGVQLTSINQTALPGDTGLHLLPPRGSPREWQRLDHEFQFHIGSIKTVTNSTMGI